MLASTSTQSIDEILAKSLEGKSISLTDAYQLINCKDTNLIVATARLIRESN